MNHRLPKLLPVLATVLLAAQVASAQTSGYQPASFYSSQLPADGAGAQSLPPLPASPLAGGVPAAAGGAFMDAHGQPVVVPANYCQGCADGYGNVCPGGCYPGGGGDPMAIDFGGYAREQCGPHYFDVSAGVVFLWGEDFFEGLQPFTEAGVGTDNFFLDPANDFGEYDPGWEIAVRYDIGPLAVLEATYMGLYDFSFFDRVVSPDVTDPPQNFALVSVFSDFGLGVPIPGIDDGQVHAIDYEADLQSTEISYRRYWVGNRPSITGTWLAGARYLRFTDEFNFDSQALVTPNVETANLNWEGENDLVGFQVGGDGWICLRQGLRIGCEGTAGIYNNRFKFENSGTFSDPNTPDFANSEDGNQVAFAAEGEASVVADILPSWSLRGGYRVLFINSLVTAENNINQSNFASTAVIEEAGLLFHGFHGGFEYIW